MHIQLVETKAARTFPSEGYLSYEESELITADLEIIFSYEGKDRSFRRAGVNVPLFVTEAKIFLKNITDANRAVWRMCFAPFVKARKEFRGVVLYTGEPNDEEGGVLDVLGPKDLVKFQNHLNYLTLRYGQLSARALLKDPTEE